MRFGTTHSYRTVGGRRPRPCASCGILTACRPQARTVAEMRLGDAEVGRANTVVFQQLSRVALAGDLTRLEDVGTVGTGQRLLRILLDEQHRGALRVDVRDDLEDLGDHHG